MNAFIGRLTRSTLWFLLLVLLLLLDVRPCGWFCADDVMWCPPSDVFDWFWVCCGCVCCEFTGLRPACCECNGDVWALWACECEWCCEARFSIFELVLLCWYWCDSCDCDNCDWPMFIMLSDPNAPYGDDEWLCNDDGWCGGMVACKMPPFMSDSIVNISSTSLCAYSLNEFTDQITFTIKNPRYNARVCGTVYFSCLFNLFLFWYLGSMLSNFCFES